MPGRRRPCSYCGHWFRTTARVRNARACREPECRRARKLDSQRRWKRGAQEKRGERLTKVLAVRQEPSRATYVKVLSTTAGDTIPAQAVIRQSLDRAVLTLAEGDAIRLQAAILIGLIRLVLLEGRGDTIALVLSRLETSGRAVLGGTA